MTAGKTVGCNIAYSARNQTARCVDVDNSVN